MKSLIRIDCDRIRAYKLKKGPRQMVSIAGRLYRVDDRFMAKDSKTDHAMIFYEIDSTQPLMMVPRVIDPDMTKVFIDSSKIAGTKKSLWMNLSGSKMMEYLTVAIVIGAILYGFLVGGGL